MLLKREKDVINLIEEDDWMMKILQAVSTLDLTDWWVCAGFVRSKIWDNLHGFRERTDIDDIDVIYFDHTIIEESEEKRLEKNLQLLLPNVPWSVKNQARMHVVNQIPPYTSTVDAISKFPETVTSLGVKLDTNNKVILTAPNGIEDVLNMTVKPTSFFSETKERLEIYEKRVKQKNWNEVWHLVTFEEAYEH